MIGRKLDIITEYEDRVPAYVEQMFDRLEASGIIVGWDRNEWEIWTTTIGLDIRIAARSGTTTTAETGNTEASTASPEDPGQGSSSPVITGSQAP